MKENKEDTKNAEPEIENLKEWEYNVNIILKLISGIILLSFGSNTLVNGSQSLAILLGVNEIIIGHIMLPEHLCQSWLLQLLQL